MDLEAVQVYDRLQRAFPGEADPAAVVVRTVDRRAPRGPGGDGEPRARALASGRVHSPVTVEVNEARTVAQIEP